jgi:hypothetical protein
MVNNIDIWWRILFLWIVFLVFVLRWKSFSCIKLNTFSYYIVERKLVIHWISFILYSINITLNLILSRQAIWVEWTASVSLNMISLCALTSPIRDIGSGLTLRLRMLIKIRFVLIYNSFKIIFMRVSST